jgi:hypothetical protein
MSASSLKTYRVVVIEWLSHKAVIKAESAQHAEEEARRLWAESGFCEIFRFEDSGVDGITVEELGS